MIKKRGALMSKVQEKISNISYLCFLLNSRCTVWCWSSWIRSNYRKSCWIRRLDGVIITGIFIHILIWMMYVLLKEKWEFS